MSHGVLGPIKNARMGGLIGSTGLLDNFFFSARSHFSFGIFLGGRFYSFVGRIECL
jgi:hypothetical protein